jgi:hypothetical protein
MELHDGSLNLTSRDLFPGDDAFFQNDDLVYEPDADAIACKHHSGLLLDDNDDNEEEVINEAASTNFSIFSELPKDAVKIYNDIMKYPNSERKEVKEWFRSNGPTRSGILEVNSLLTCSECTYINDQIMNRYLELILVYLEVVHAKNPCALRVYIFNTLLMSRLEDEKGDYKENDATHMLYEYKTNIFMGGYSYVFIPINIDNQHWTFIRLDMQKKIILYVDSLNSRKKANDKNKKSDYNRYCRSAICFLIDFAHMWSVLDFKQDEWRMDYHYGPVQVQSDCGAFTAMGIQAMALGFNWKNVGVEQTASFRARLIYGIYINNLVKATYLPKPVAVSWVSTIPNMKAMVDSIGEGCGPLDLNKGDSIANVFFFYWVMKVSLIVTIYWLGCGGGAESLYVIFGLLNSDLPAEVLSQLRIVAMELRTGNEIGDNARSLIKKFLAKNNNNISLDLKRKLLYIMGYNGLCLDLPKTAEEANISLFYSCATVNPRMYKRTMIKYLRSGVRYYFVAFRWAKALFDASWTFQNKVSIQVVPCTLAGSSGSLPLSFFVINDEAIIIDILNELEKSLLQEGQTVVKPQLIRRTINSLSAGTSSTIGRYICTDYDTNPRVSMPIVINAWRNINLFPEVQTTVDLFMKRENTKSIEVKEGPSTPKKSEVIEILSTPNIISSKRKIQGIKNDYHNCWLSSLVQILLATFVNASKKDISYTINKIYHDDMTLLFNALAQNSRPAVIDGLMKKLLLRFGQVGGRYQQDPTELLIKSLTDDNPRNCFYATTNSVGVCKACGTVVMSNDDFFLVQTVHIVTFKKLTTLEDLIKEALKTDIDYKCESSSSACSHEKVEVNSDFLTRSDRFLVQIVFNCKEDENNASRRRFDGEIFQAVSIPREIDGYNLNGMVLTNATHSGSGHYIALVYYSEPAGWYICDDLTVTQLNEKQVFDDNGDFDRKVLKSHYPKFNPLILSYIK